MIEFILVAIALIAVATPLPAFLGSFIAGSVSDDDEISMEEGAYSGRMVGWAVGIACMCFFVARMIGLPA